MFSAFCRRSKSAALGLEDLCYYTVILDAFFLSNRISPDFAQCEFQSMSLLRRCWLTSDIESHCLIQKYLDPPGSPLQGVMMHELS
jgi:hypothetical protein